MLEQFLHGTNHPIQAINESLVGYKAWEPIKQVLFGERVDFLDPRIPLLTTDKQVNC